MRTDRIVHKRELEKSRGRNEVLSRWPIVPSSFIHLFVLKTFERNKIPNERDNDRRKSRDGD